MGCHHNGQDLGLFCDNFLFDLVCPHNIPAGKPLNTSSQKTHPYRGWPRDSQKAQRDCSNIDGHWTPSIKLFHFKLPAAWNMFMDSVPDTR